MTLTIQQEQIGTDCIWETLPNGIHVFRFVKPSRRAVDEWLEHLDAMFAALTEPEVCYVMDYSIKGLVPIAYGAQRSREWLAANPNHAPAYVTFIHNNTMMVSMFDSIVRLLPAHHVTTRFFKADDYEKAIDWLLLQRSDVKA